MKWGFKEQQTPPLDRAKEEDEGEEGKEGGNHESASSFQKPF